jgi:ribonuclease H2 subunit C
MLAIQSPQERVEKCTPNLLPCRVDHNGAVSASTRYWNPEVEVGESKYYAISILRLTVKDGTQTAYFRGRKLRGRKVELPQNYKGSLIDYTSSCFC